MIDVKQCPIFLLLGVSHTTPIVNEIYTNEIVIVFSLNCRNVSVKKKSQWSKFAYNCRRVSYAKPTPWPLGYMMSISN